MRFPRMTTRRWMIAVVLASLLLAAFVARRERLRRVAALQAAYENARLTRVVAESEFTGYLAVYKMERETVLGEIALAESDKKRAEDRLEWSDKMLAKGAVSEDQNRVDRIGLEQKTFALRQAETRQKMLEPYTTEKSLWQLRAEFEKAQSDELARKAAYEQEQAALERGIW